MEALDVIIWICVFIFGATGIVAILDLADIRKISSSFMRKALFTSLILELAIVMVAIVSENIGKKDHEDSIYIYKIVIKVPVEKSSFEHRIALVRNQDGILKKGFFLGLDCTMTNSSIDEWEADAIAINDSLFTWQSKHDKSHYSSKANVEFFDDSWERFTGKGKDGNKGEQNDRSFSIEGYLIYPNN